jgi:hypothetical protein
MTGGGWQTVPTNHFPNNLDFNIVIYIYIYIYDIANVKVKNILESKLMIYIRRS